MKEQNTPRSHSSLHLLTRVLHIALLFFTFTAFTNVFFSPKNQVLAMKYRINRNPSPLCQKRKRTKKGEESTRKNPSPTFHWLSAQLRHRWRKWRIFSHYNRKRARVRAWEEKSKVQSMKWAIKLSSRTLFLRFRFGQFFTRCPNEGGKKFMVINIGDIKIIFCDGIGRAHLLCA